MKVKIVCVALLALCALVFVGCQTSGKMKSDRHDDTMHSNNIDKALMLINSFETGDTRVAEKVLTKDYIQHNLAYPTGRDAFIKAVEDLAQAPVKTTVTNARAFQDGDFVFLHSIYNFAGTGDMVAFDIFRFEEGKIAEHWDNLQALAPPNPSGRTQADGPTMATDLDKTEENKKLIENFLYDVVQGNNLEKAPMYFNGDEYIQHNSQIGDGVMSFNKAFAALAAEGMAIKFDTVHLVLAEGNFVLAVSEGTYGDVPTAYYDLFRVENGKVAEHWDVIEPIADKSTWANDNGKF